MRALLAPNRPYITVHYTGVNVPYGDWNDSPQEIRNIQAWAASAAKRTPWEYNYVFDTQGNVWEYAGLYQAAHSGGENSLAYGCLFLNGTHDEPTAAQIEAFRWWRWVLVQFNHLAENHQMRPHRDMPAAQTSCPGGLILGKWNLLSQPWVDTPAPPPPPPPTPDPPAPTAEKWIEPNCRFTLSPGDSPWAVAHIAYGDGRRYPELVTHNPGLWYVGRQVIVPGAAGAGFKVRPGDGPYAILRDIWPADDPNTRLATFYRWNGGPGRVLHPGDIVYAPVDPMS